MTFKEKMFSFEGRLNRLGYLWATLSLLGICIVVDGVGIGLLMTQNVGLMVIGGLILAVAVFFGYWAVFALAAKRLHDIGHSGWLTLWVSIGGAILGTIGSQNVAVSVLSSLLLLAWGCYLYFCPGQKGTNRFGPQPGSAEPILAPVAPVQAA